MKTSGGVIGEDQFIYITTSHLYGPSREHEAPDHLTKARDKDLTLANHGQSILMHLPDPFKR